MTEALALHARYFSSLWASAALYRGLGRGRPGASLCPVSATARVFPVSEGALVIFQF